MNSEALQTFVAIQQAGGFSAAAEQLNRSQPAISRRISLLEAELGAPLFERTAGSGALSQAGEVLLPFALRVLASLKDASNAMADLRAGGGGPLSMAVVGTLAGAGLTQVLKEFILQFPRVDLAIQTASSDNVSQLVRRGEAVIGLRYFDDPSPDLVGRPLPPEPLVVVCSAAHPLAGTAQSSLRDLKDQHWLAFPRDPGRKEGFAETIFTQFLVRDVPTFRWTPVDSLTAQKRLIEANYGIALLPVSSVVEERAARALATIDIGDLDVAIPVVAVVRKDGYLSPASVNLLERLTVEG